MENLYEVIGISQYHGKSHSGKEYELFTYEVDVDGEKAKIKSFEGSAKIGDYVKVGLGIKKTVYGNELTAVVLQVVRQEEANRNCRNE